MTYILTLKDNTVINNYTEETNPTKFKEQENYIHSLYLDGIDQIPRDRCIAYSDKFTHEYLGEETVIGCVNRKYANYLDNKFASVHRLYCIDSKTAFIYVTGGFWEDNPSWLHEKALITSVSTHFEEDPEFCSYKYNKKANDYKKYWFRASAEISKSEYGIELKDDSDEFIMAIVENNTLKTVRKMIPSTDNGDDVLENWQSIYILNARKAGKKEFLKKLYESGL
tara:strand:- start:661 stop:1335 length:675 start_codon:yes stop_codon:yes gene_type:complete